jgi:hypothetical protein
MANIRKWLEEAESFYGEPIEAIVVGKHYDRAYSDDNPHADENIVLGREDGLNKLDQEYDNGYGGAGCYPMFAWTASRVFMIHEYDGATGPTYVPRNPVPCEPEFGGRSLGSDEIDRIVAARAK